MKKMISCLVIATLLCSCTQVEQIATGELVPGPTLDIEWVYQNNLITNYKGRKGLCLEAVIESWERWENDTVYPILDYEYQIHTPGFFTYNNKHKKDPSYMTKFEISEKLSPVKQLWRTYATASMPSTVKFLKDNPKVLNNIEVIGVVDSFSKVMRNIYSSMYKISSDRAALTLSSSPAVLQGDGWDVKSPENAPHVILVNAISWNRSTQYPVKIAFLNPNEDPANWYDIYSPYSMPNPSKHFTEYIECQKVRDWAEHRSNIVLKIWGQLTQRTTIAIMKKPALSSGDQISDVSGNIDDVLDIPDLLKQDMANSSLGECYR